MKPLPILILVTALFTISSITAVHAAPQFGLRIGQYNDADDLFVGAELLSAIQPHLYFNPNVEYVLAENMTYLTLNADFNYNFFKSSSVFLWAGGGPGLAYLNPEGPAESNSELAINLLFGLGLDLRGSLTPYVQVKFILGDVDETVLAFGLRF